MIDMELANLRLRFKIKKKKKKKKKKKAAQRKKGKKFPGSKECSKRDPRDLLAELIEAGIVKYLMPAKLDDMIGEPNYLRPRLEYQYEAAPDPSMFDLRNLLAEKVALPLGSRFLKAQR